MRDGKLLRNTQEEHGDKAILSDDFLDDFLDAGSILPAQKERLLQQSREFLQNLQQDEDQQNHLKNFIQQILALQQEVKNSALEFSETIMPAMNFTHHSSQQQARILGYQLGAEARKFLAQERAKGNVATMVEAIYHAKQTRRI